MSSKIKLGKNPYVSMMRTAWKYARKERGEYVKIYSMFSLSNLFDAANPIIWGWFINELQRKGTAVIESTWKYALAYLILWFLDWVFHGISRVKERKLAFNLSQNFLQELYHKAVHLPTKWHQDNHSGATINRMRKAYEALKEFFENGFMYFHTIMKFLFSLSAMIYFAPYFGGLAILMGIGIIWIINRFDKPFIAAHRETNEREHIVSSTLFDSLSNIITVITLRLEERMERGLMQKVNNVFPPFKRKVYVNEWKWFTVDFCISLIYVSILIGYIYQNYVPGEVFLIGGLVTLMSYVQRFTSVFHNFAWQYNQIVQYDTDVQTAFNIIEAYEEQHLPESEVALNNNWKKMVISQLNFSHQSSEQEEGGVRGLINLNIAFERGQKVALIGESGSGKSTLLALLRGLYQAQPGLRLNVDDQTFEHLDVISNHVTLFPQEPEIFESTIAYNINLGLPSEREELERICKVVQFEEVVHQLPDGLDTDIKEKGVNLSGGQKQRLALARGVLAAKESDIVLLDEPTSSVDPKTELIIYKRLFKEFRHKAVISSLHRLHLLRLFDYVYVMDQGRVVDEGTFEDLLEHSKAFQDLWNHQKELHAQH